MNNLIVVGPRDKVPEGYTVINTTSKDNNIGKKLSPFFLGPVFLYENYSSYNVENAWQFSKVYKEYSDELGKPSKEYFLWARMGWKDKFAHRYPYGKGAVPLYSYWKFKENNEWKEYFLSYIDARKYIYFQLYLNAVIDSSALKDIESRLKNNEKIALWDFDAYNHIHLGISYQDVIHDPKRKCGHAFVLYGILTKQIYLKDNKIQFNFYENISNPL